MPYGPRASSVIATIRPFRWRIAFTYALTVIEVLLELSYPWATGLAINGLLAQDYRMIAPVMTAWVLHTAIGSGRQMSMVTSVLRTTGMSLKRLSALSPLTATEAVVPYPAPGCDAEGPRRHSQVQITGEAAAPRLTSS